MLRKIGGVVYGTTYAQCTPVIRLRNTYCCTVICMADSPDYREAGHNDFIKDIYRALPSVLLDNINQMNTSYVWVSRVAATLLSLTAATAVINLFESGSLQSFTRF